MGTAHIPLTSGPISAEKRMYVARNVRRMAKKFGCSEFDVGRSVRIAQQVLQRTGDRTKAIHAGMEYAVQADLRTRRENVSWPRPPINWINVAWGVLGGGLAAALLRLAYLIVMRAHS